MRLRHPPSRVQDGRRKQCQQERPFYCTDSIHGVGPAYAQTIIDARPFKSSDDLLRKKVIPQDNNHDPQRKEFGSSDSLSYVMQIGAPAFENYGVTIASAILLLEQ